MIINKKKTKVISFTKSRKWDFPPELKFKDGTLIETETKLLGLVLSDNLRWQKNTSHICEKARQKIWMLRRLVKLGLDRLSVFNAYSKEVRSLLELAVPVWHSTLTKARPTTLKGYKKINRSESYLALPMKIINRPVNILTHSLLKRGALSFV